MVQLGQRVGQPRNAVEAIEAYKKALAVKTDYFDANYNLGALYFNQAVQGTNAANDMWKPRMTKAESAEQKRLEDEAKALFETARPYLEAAHAIDAEDLETMRSLKDIYARTGEDEKMLVLMTRSEAPIDALPRCRGAVPPSYIFLP